MEYKLTLNEQQYRCIINGMEFYHRILCGQTTYLNEVSPHRIDLDTLHALKRQMFPELDLNQSYSWNGGHPNKYFDNEQAQSYQLYREMVHFKTLNSGVENVYSSETLTTRKAEMPKIEIIKSKK